MKKIALKVLMAFAILLSQASSAQFVSKTFFGQNAWMPDSVGNVSFNGNLNKTWGSIAASGAGVIRFGGTAVDQHMPTTSQYMKMVDSIRGRGMEPMLQVPYNKGAYTPQQAAAIVRYVNITKGKAVKYWVIGNEPDLAYGYTTSAQVAAYMKAFSSAMKAVDPSILIVGPECAWYNRNIYLGITTPGGPDDLTGKDAAGHYYVDMISFHTYPFKGDQQRSAVLSNLTGTGQFQENCAELNSRIQNCNSVNHRTDAPVKFGITEANIDYSNPGGDNLNGVGANSFIGGQFWAEMMGIAMQNGASMINFWSAIEGGGSATDIGFLGGSDPNLKKPSYYHYQMMAQNFRGNAVSVTDNHANVKAYASNDGQRVAVIILNEDQASTLNFTLKLNTTSVSGASTLKLNVNANIAKEYSDHINSQSSIVLVFDMQGNLIKKIEYKLNGNADANQAPTTTNYRESTSGTSEVKDAGKVNMKVYPNPAPHGKFTLEVEANDPTAKAYVYNIAGQLVKVVKLNPVEGQVSEKIDMTNNTASGLYIVQVKTETMAVSKKLIVTK